MTVGQEEHWCKKADRAARETHGRAKERWQHGKNWRRWEPWKRWKCWQRWKHRPRWQNVILTCLLVPDLAFLMFGAQGLVCYMERKNPLVAIEIIAMFAALGISALLSMIAMAAFRSRCGLWLFLVAVAAAIGLYVRLAYTAF